MTATDNEILAANALLNDFSDEQVVELMRKRGFICQRISGVNLEFNDETRVIQWNKEKINFTYKARLRYKLIKELYLAEEKMLTAAEIGEILYGNDLFSWNAIRMLAERTYEQLINYKDFPYFLEIENQNILLKKKF
jgi:hypothetical protein